MKKITQVFQIILMGLLVGSCQYAEELLPLIKKAESHFSDKEGEMDWKDFKPNYGAFLTGREEVPEVDAPGSGTAKFEVSMDGSAIHYEIKVANTKEIRVGHIHLAPFGQNGGVVVTLLQFSEPTGLENGLIAQGTITEADLSGQLEGESLSTLVSAMDNGNAYVNIHTVSFPGGEIRGQISMIQEDGKFKTELSGDEEVPPRETDACGDAKVKFNAKNTVMNFKVTVEKLENVRFAHIHLAKMGANGPVVVDLRLDKVEGPVNGLYAEGSITSEDLKGLLLGGDLEMLREAIRTGNAYVNVHTDKYPPGEIRGQLK
ncbi:MAG: CHRD domain-containing protein [Cyclobacteriaceae bacterium]